MQNYTFEEFICQTFVQTKTIAFVQVVVSLTAWITVPFLWYIFCRPKSVMVSVLPTYASRQIKFFSELWLMVVGNLYSRKLNYNYVYYKFITISAFGICISKIQWNQTDNNYRTRDEWMIRAKLCAKIMPTNLKQSAVRQLFAQLCCKR